MAEGNRRIDAGEQFGPGRLDEMLFALGLETLLETGDDDAAPAELQRLATERDEARAERDFARADELRDRIAAAGWEVRDTSEGGRLVRRS